MNIASRATQYRRLSVVSQLPAIAFIFLHQFFRVSLKGDVVIPVRGERRVTSLALAIASNNYRSAEYGTVAKQSSKRHAIDRYDP